MEYRDYYATLGVPRTASQADIKKAFRKLARQHHPDVNKGDAAAEQRFKEVSEANEVLSDPEKRKLYDQLGANWQGTSMPAPGSGQARVSPFAGFERLQPRPVARVSASNTAASAEDLAGFQRLLPHVLRWRRGRRRCDARALERAPSTGSDRIDRGSAGQMGGSPASRDRATATCGAQPAARRGARPTSLSTRLRRARSDCSTSTASGSR